MKYIKVAIGAIIASYIFTGLLHVFFKPPSICILEEDGTVVPCPAEYLPDLSE